MHTEAQGQTLLDIARASIDEALGGPPVALPPDAWLRAPAATFVTVFRQGRLHGCIGNIEPVRSLGEDVRRNAVAAALHDPRATPLSRAELGELRVEVSKLSPLTPIPFEDEEDALSKIRVGEDGIVLAFHGRRATFLPQVWKSFDTARDFLRELKRKAGFAGDFWHPDIELYRYSSEKWVEPDPMAN
jgi:AmmeMemoRadiSam system protein A